MAAKTKRAAKKVTRRKRSPDEARAESLVAARDLLLAGGPDAVTLKAIGEQVGMTHANIIHHFGSAEGLQTALMAAMVRDLAAALGDAVAHVRSDAAAPRALIDIVFNAFDAGGAGRLAAWIALSGDLDHLEPVRAALTDLVGAIEEKFAGTDEAARKRIAEVVLFIALFAFGDSVIGTPVRDMLGQPGETGRKVATDLLKRLIA